MLKAGVIGLGQMGSLAAACLVNAGRDLTVFDIDPDAARRWPGGDTLPPVVASCAEVARMSDVIMVFVVDASQVSTVLKGPDGILASATPGTIVVIGSTISLDALAEMREAAAEAGVVVVDCGIAVLPGGPVSKTMIGMIGAEPDVFDRISPVLDDFTQLSERMGGPGAGMAAKIARNLMYFATWRAACECAKLADAAGVDPDKMLRVNQLREVQGSGTITWLTQWAAQVAPSDEGTRQMAHIKRLLLKDVAAAGELGENFSVALPLVPLLLETADEIVAPWRG